MRKAVRKISLHHSRHVLGRVAVRAGKISITSTKHCYAVISVMLISKSKDLRGTFPRESVTMWLRWLKRRTYLHGCLLDKWQSKKPRADRHSGGRCRRRLSHRHRAASSQSWPLAIERISPPAFVAAESSDCSTQDCKAAALNTAVKEATPASPRLTDKAASGHSTPLPTPPFSQLSV